MKRAAFVVHRCGEEIVGGAEALCLQLARQLTAEQTLDVSILTTTAQDYLTWRNKYATGPSLVGGTKLLRFPVDVERNVRAFDRLSARTQFRPSTAEDEERWMRSQGPMCSGLQEYVRRYGDLYDAFVFFGYLYATTYFTLPLVQNRSILVPLAHDEWPLRFHLWDDLFARPRAFVFNTPEEHEIVRRRFGRLDVDGPIAGAGVPREFDGVAERFRERYGIQGPFMLYAGRIDRSKGCDELLAAFRKLQKAGTDFKLVMMGDNVMRIKSRAGVIVTGAVPEADKWDALAACELYVNLSPYESLSIGLLEAWRAGKPAIVSARSAVMVGQCRRAQAGLWVANEDEFVAAMSALTLEVRQQLGAAGNEFVLAHYSWSGAARVYRELIDSLSG